MSLEERIRAATHEYIARKPCGCCVACAIDLGDDDTADSVAEWIRWGLTVERVSHEDFRLNVMKEDTFMKCPHGQMILPIT